MKTKSEFGRYFATPSCWYSVKPIFSNALHYKINKAEFSTIFNAFNGVLYWL
jgi:hypothetical protein